MKIYFITGTDTDSGKTYVTCQLLDFFNKRNKKALALKPVASGCDVKDGQLLSQDVLNLQKYNYDSALEINCWKFAPPISPHIAANELNLPITAQKIADFCLEKQFSTFDYLFIEGAGGLMAPLNEEETWLDFLKWTQIPAIVVVGMQLGCLNHALLTDAVLKHNRITCAGWIANCLDKNMLAREENIKTLSLRMHMPQLTTISYQGMLSDESILQKLQ
ncbi:dethiobiotin synthase [Legionella micdadei]|uniref:ATP-dependent dethiobiotin synthetase BioD n=1 Tax=Legionella micdadei TaxID=451 RepID=A0A098GEJ1_LEGMI|nr:dethiobiotin synthase [Legionella micdadei]ARG97540.1 dethiobiotin synthase [Legionella micdadei]ARH00148.1 dethiobiotin synthase [Legionella micdadei]KTD27616.1 dethiobiotin synthetase [Legionella micdadei]NSL17599.1 dethiobiotin synthase [Legionella micdadei]CEG60898.1 Dethiobiotin synthetase [Legionella micdadei]